MWLEYLRIAWSVLRGNLFRSALTIASIVIGAFSIVLMTSLAESGLSTLSRSFEELGGSRLISVWRKSPESMENKQASYSRGLTRLDPPAIKNIPHLVTTISFVSLRHKPLEADNGKRLPGDVVASDAEFLGFFKYKLAEGRALDDHDLREHARVCVIGSDLADAIWGAGENVLGRIVTFSGLHCRIVGRLQKLDRWGIGFGWEWNQVLVAPIDTVADHESVVIETGRRLFMLTDGPQNNEIVKRILNAVLLERHHGVDDFSIFDFAKRLASFYQVFLIMKVIVGLLAGISLLVGGVGIMNIMLVSVSERVREIGIRKALGATPADIGRQFVVEAMLLSGFGGGLGAALGMGGTVLGGILIHHFKPSWQTHISEPAVTVAVVSAVLIGLLFGYWPAKSASRLDPVTAIRTNN
jgi:putative ABC transport system permease protein